MCRLLKRIVPIAGWLGMLAVLLSTCSSTIFHNAPLQKVDGKYDVLYPYGYDQGAISHALETVRLLNTTVYYQTYVFPKDARVTRPQINKQFLEEGNFDKTVFTDYSVGTATIIYQRGKRIAILTCAHVIDFPDTILTYYAAAAPDGEQVVHSFATLAKQENHIAELRQGRNFKILARDRDLDLAILGKEMFSTPADEIPVFTFPIGSARELEWGNLLYLIGFPAGRKSITTGIVSNPDRDKFHSFQIDALFNRGFSGGIALAMRDGLPNLELVGIVNEVAATDETILIPGDYQVDPDLIIDLPYEGDIYATSRKRINYGISYGIAIETIYKFIQNHRDAIEREGYEVDKFFKVVPTNVVE